MLLHRMCRGLRKSEMSVQQLRHRIFFFFSIRPHKILGQILVAHKDLTKVKDHTGVVNLAPCGGCNKVYVGETNRSVGERTKVHNTKIANNLSASSDHHQKTEHEPDLDIAIVLCMENKPLPHKVRDAIFIKETSPTLSRKEAA